jgi:multidrug transporter EmrE-like cation transporter
MTIAALLLVLASAVCHASWNFLLKRSDHKVAFLGSAGLVAAVAWLGPAVIIAAIQGITVAGLALGGITAVLHGVYGLSLARGYRLGDLSSVYPVSRGVGLALIPIAAALLLDETISAVAVAGIAMIAAGVYLLHTEPHALRDLASPIRALNAPAGRSALLTGALITVYSLWDKNALDKLSPVVLNQFAMTGHAVITTGVALRLNPDELRAVWKGRTLNVIAAGMLIQLAYLLVLAALETSRVSYIAPSREVGIVFGTALGVIFLGEGIGLWRVWTSLVIIAGVIVLAVAP